MNNNSRRLPPHAVDRPKLRSLLDSGLESPLSLIVAPAGAGKTVLLAQWINSRPDLTTAWFDVTAEDAAPAVLASRIIDAVAVVTTEYACPAAPVVTAGGHLADWFLEDLARSLAGPDKVVLIFDDLERIVGSPVVTDLWRLVDLLPANVHAVFASRVDLHLGWSRHRLRHGLVEIRQRELAFDDQTTAHVMDRITHRPVSPATLAAVTERTEGWAVGVQLTALGFRFSDDPARVVDALLYSDQLVVEYMSEEVLSALETDRRDALVRLSVLDEFSAELATEFTGLDGEQFLSDLERDSLFVVNVTSRPGWHRFHPLFRDLLRRRLHTLDPRAEESLLDAAAEWFLRTGDVDTGVEYLCRAGRWDAVLARALAEGDRGPDLTRAAVVGRWLARLPADIRATSTRAELLFALTDEMAGRESDAVEKLRALLMGDRLRCGERQIALAHVAAGVQYLPHAESFVDAARRGRRLLELEPEARRPNLFGMTSRPALVLLCEASLGRGLFYLGELAAARFTLRGAIAHSENANTVHLVDALGCLALVNSFTGRLVEATERAEEALGLAREYGVLSDPAAADAFLALAVVAVQRGEPTAAIPALEEMMGRATANERTPLLWIGHLAAVLIDSDNAHPLIATEPPGPPPPVVRRAMIALNMRRARFGGTPAPAPTAATRWSAVAFEEVAALLSAQRTEAARGLLSRLRLEEDPHSPLAAIERDILTAWMHAIDGRPLRARERLESALTIARTEGLVHPFVRAGKRVIDLVDEMFSAHDDFAGRIVRVARSATTRTHSGLVQELTARELELLAYLPTRLTIGDIADRCYVSTNTVKTHLGHIYRKLGVPGRNAAIDRAVELNLLQRHDTEIVPT